MIRQCPWHVIQTCWRPAKYWHEQSHRFNSEFHSAMQWESYCAPDMPLLYRQVVWPTKGLHLRPRHLNSEWSFLCLVTWSASLTNDAWIEVWVGCGKSIILDIFSMLHMRNPVQIVNVGGPSLTSASDREGHVYPSIATSLMPQNSSPRSTKVIEML